MRVAISSAHGKHVAGAIGLINEVAESRRVVPRVASLLGSVGAEVMTFDDDSSRSQGANLRAVVNWHNRQTRDIDVSVHFNAHMKTDKPRGVEVLFASKSTQSMAREVSQAIARAGNLFDRGAKQRSNLSFLNRTRKPAILIEVCFVDSRADVNAYETNFDAICRAIAEAISGREIT